MHRSAHRRSTHRRRTISLCVAAATLVAACSSGDDTATPGSDVPEASSTEAPDSVPDTTASTPADTDPPVESTTSTTPTTVPATTTTLPPPPMAALSAQVIPTLAENVQYDGVADLVVLEGDVPEAILVGSTASAPGERQHASVYAYVDGSRLVDAALPDTDFVESSGEGVVAIGDELVATGLVVDDAGRSHAAIWRSADRGATWVEPEQPLDPGTAGVAITQLDGVVTIIARIDTPTGYDMVAATEGPDGWVTTPLATSGDDVFVSGITNIGASIVVTGTADRGDRRFGHVWVSADRGATFTASADPLIEQSDSINRAGLGVDGLVLTASQPTNQPMILLTSPDGVTWRRIDPAVTDDVGEPEQLIGSRGGPAVTFADRLVFSEGNVFASIVIADAEGRGVLRASIDTADIFGSGRPFAMGGRLYSVANSVTSFRITRASEALDDWSAAAKPVAGRNEPEPSFVDLVEAVDGVRARSVSYPHVEKVGNSLSWSNSQLWAAATDGAWAVDATGLDASYGTIALNGSSQVALLTADDPADSDAGGPKGGTSVSFRGEDGAWTAPQLILSGPGGDYGSDVAPLGDGFVLVGEQVVADADNRYTGSIVIQEYAAGGQWTAAPIAADLGPQPSLSSVATATNGLAVAVGDREVGEGFDTLLMARATDGTWSPTTLPTESTDLDIVAISGGADDITMLVRDGDAWTRYRTTDGTNFDAVPLIFDDTLTTNPIELVRIEEQSYVIGTTSEAGRVERLAMWRLADDGTTESIEIPDGPVGLDVEVDSAIGVDGNVLVAGIDLHQAMVWTLEPPIAE